MQNLIGKNTSLRTKIEQKEKQIFKENVNLKISKLVLWNVQKETLEFIKRRSISC